MVSNRPVAVSLFDMTGNMVRPLANMGYECLVFDLQNINHTEECKNNGSIQFISADLLDAKWSDLIKSKCPKIIYSFPPCTDLAVSGALHFASKLAANPEYRAEAMSLVYIGRDIAEFVGCPYMIENPVSVISSEWRKPDFSFHPYEFGGYLPATDVHPEWPEYILPRDAYPKKTCLWTGNGFEMPSKLPVPIVDGYSSQYLKLGGKSIKTKNIRSATARGFALACALSLTA
jgi:hypothetical protein